MATKNLTARAVESVKAIDGKRLELRDAATKGLILRVSPHAVKSWALLYRRKSDGKRRRLTLGNYPVMSLVEAREAALIALSEIAGGNDPAGSKQSQRNAATFQQLAEAWLTRHAKPNKRTWREDQRKLKIDVLPILGQMRAAEVRKRDIVTLLDEIAGRGSPIAANRTLALISAIFRWALSEDLIDTAPTIGIRPRVTEIPRDRTLSNSEIRGFWLGLETAAMTQQVRDVLRLCLLTGQRVGEVTGLSWAEIDFDNLVWTVPKERTKNRKAHRVPISDPAMRIIAANRNDSNFVFVSPATGRAIGSHAPARAMLRVRDHFSMPPFHVHDLRRTLASGLAEMGVDRVTIGAALNHITADRSITGQVYDRYSRDKEKRRALDAWASELERIVAGTDAADNVVRLTRND